MSLTALATDSVDLEPYSGSDEHLNASYGSSVTYSNARVQRENELTRDDEGNEVVSTGRVFVMGADATGDAVPQSRLTLPDGTTEEVIRSEYKTNPSRLDHTVVWF